MAIYTVVLNYVDVKMILKLPPSSASYQTENTHLDFITFCMKDMKVCII